MRRHSIWFSPRDDSHPSFERVPPLWEEFRPLTWSIFVAIFAGSAITSWYASKWVGSTVYKIETIERDQEALHAGFRNN
jgi:hypothetical protein